MRGDVSHGVLDSHGVPWGYIREICCSGFEAQGGFSKLVDAHPDYIVIPTEILLEKTSTPAVLGKSSRQSPRLRHWFPDSD